MLRLLERKRIKLALVVATLTGVTVVALMLRGNVMEESYSSSRLALHIDTNNLAMKQKRSTHLNITHYESIKTIKRRLPQAIIIGARKCGTRALLRFLELNPWIKTARKEVHFFDKDQNYKRGLSWYLTQMPESTQGQITVEKSPAYFVTQGVADRVKEMNSSLKLILIIRDPVTRLISDYSQLIANKLKLPGEDDEEGSDYSSLAQQDSASYEYLTNLSNSSGGSSANKTLIWSKAEENFEKYVLRSDGGIDDQHRAVRIGMYSIYLEKWRAVFPKEQFHFVDGERLIREPHVELKKLELFLNLTPTITEKNFVFNNKKGFYCISSINDSSTNQQDNSTSLISCLSRSKGRKHVLVRKDLIEKLQNFYAPYNEYLYSMTGINFNRFNVQLK